MKLFSWSIDSNIRALAYFDATSISPTSNPSLSYKLITISPTFCLKRSENEIKKSEIIIQFILSYYRTLAWKLKQFSPIQSLSFFIATMSVKGLVPACTFPRIIGTA